MLRTTFTELVGVEAPIQMSGMGSVGGPELAAAVSQAGGLGTNTVAGLTPNEVEARVDLIRTQTKKPFALNFLIPVVDTEAVKAAARACRVVDFFWGRPDAELVRIAHAGGALVSWQTGSLEEAVAAEAAGCDFLIAQGIEAGGHIRGQLGVLQLLTEVVEAVKVPVLAAGGIGNARALAGVIAAGAAGARIGTRFLAAGSTSTAHSALPHTAYCDRRSRGLRPCRPRPQAIGRECGQFPASRARRPIAASWEPSPRWRATRASQWATSRRSSRQRRSSTSWSRAQRLSCWGRSLR